MTRTARYKAHYFAMVGGAGLLALGILTYFRFAPLAILAVIVAMLVPGRILGFFWRDQLRGLRLLQQRDYAASKAASLRFLDYLHASPWIRHLIWLGSSGYSRDPEVLALNNLGAAEVQLGEHDSARAHLGQAIARDPLCPLPFLNLGMLAMKSGDTAEAERCFAEAKRLGYANALSDRIVRASQARFANTDGR